MGDGETKTVHGSHHVKIEGVPGAEALLFHAVTPPAGTLTGDFFETWDGQNKIMKHALGHQKVEWSECTISRGVDENADLFTWFKDTLEQGADQTKTDITITVFGPDGSQICAWSMTGAVPTNYTASALSAQTNEVLTEMVSIRAETVELVR